jgi:hypothetical protein
VRFNFSTSSVVPCQLLSIGNVGKARDRQRSGPHAAREIAARGYLGRDAGGPTMGVDIDGDGFPQDIQRGGGVFSRLGGRSRTDRCHAAGEHHPKRGRCRAPHPLPPREPLAVTAAIHAVLPRMRIEDAVYEDNRAALGEDRFRDHDADVLAMAQAGRKVRADEV